jgi:hypothetical protein
VVSCPKTPTTRSNTERTQTANIPSFVEARLIDGYLRKDFFGCGFASVKTAEPRPEVDISYQGN